MYRSVIVVLYEKDFDFLIKSVINPFRINKYKMVKSRYAELCATILYSMVMKGINIRPSGQIPVQSQ